MQDHKFFFGLKESVDEQLNCFVRSISECKLIACNFQKTCDLGTRRTIFRIHRKIVSIECCCYCCKHYWRTPNRVFIEVKTQALTAALCGWRIWSHLAHTLLRKNHRCLTSTLLAWASSPSARANWATVGASSRKAVSLNVCVVMTLTKSLTDKPPRNAATPEVGNT